MHGTGADDKAAGFEVNAGILAQRLHQCDRFRQSKVQVHGPATATGFDDQSSAQYLRYVFNQALIGLDAAIAGVYVDHQQARHQQALAADIHAKGYTAQELFKVISGSNFGFDQLILEKIGGKEWVHISVQPRERNDDFSITD